MPARRGEFVQQCRLEQAVFDDVTEVGLANLCCVKHQGVRRGRCFRAKCASARRLRREVPQHGSRRQRNSVCAHSRARWRRRGGPMGYPPVGGCGRFGSMMQCIRGAAVDAMRRGGRRHMRQQGHRQRSTRQTCRSCQPQSPSKPRRRARQSPRSRAPARFWQAASDQTAATRDCAASQRPAGCWQTFSPGHR